MGKERGAVSVYNLYTLRNRHSRPPTSTGRRQERALHVHPLPMGPYAVDLHFSDVEELGPLELDAHVTAAGVAPIGAHEELDCGSRSVHLGPVRGVESRLYVQPSFALNAARYFPWAVWNAIVSPMQCILNVS